jgi:hypothetical protein
VSDKTTKLEPKELAEISCLHLRAARRQVMDAVDSCYQWQVDRSGEMSGGVAAMEQAREAIRLLQQTVDLFDRAKARIEDCAIEKRLLESAKKASKMRNEWPSWKQNYVLTDYTTALAEIRTSSDISRRSSAKGSNS